MPTFSTNNNYISISSQFIREKLPDANPTFVKVYVYLLMLASENSRCEYKDIANTLGLLESDLMYAINYWQNQGELFQTETGIVFSNNSQTAAKQENTAENTVQDIPHKTVDNLAEIIAASTELSDMFMLAQEILGKTIAERDMETIYWFYSDLKMPPVVILQLLEYCVSKGKNRMSYIEKVAISWNEMGLNTSESVALYLESEEQKTGFLYSIRKIMGISDRSLSQIEEKYLTKWHDEFGMSEEMIALAYEYCIIQTAKLSFPYMDKIITRWNSEGINNIADAEEDNKRFKNRTRQNETAFTQSKFSQEELEILSRNS